MFSLLHIIKDTFRFSKRNKLPKRMLVLNEEEQRLVYKTFRRLSEVSKESILKMTKKFIDLQKLSEAISRFPSVKKSSSLAGEQRNRDTLIETLCRTAADSRVFFMPTKAMLGKSYLVAKFHTFSALLKAAVNTNFPEEELNEMRQITLKIMLTIMAEDVYISLLNNTDITEQTKIEIAKALTDLWEHRLDKHTEVFAPTLIKVWTAREKLAPVFGTMLGTSELFCLSKELDANWNSFLLAKLSNQKVLDALEEFLFGISHEEVVFVRNKLQEEGIAAVSREQVAKMLNKQITAASPDAKMFYSSYVERKNNAEARRRRNIDSAEYTLEEYYISFLFEEKKNISK